MFQNLAYDTASPSGLTWIRPSSPLARVKAGQPAGCKDHRGYWVVSVGKKRFYAHRIIWELEQGPLADGLVIDHIDRDKSNNRLENLRLVSESENARNRSSKKGRYARLSSSGRKWHSYCSDKVTNKYIHVGTFDTEEQAHLAAITRRLELYWDF